MFKTQSNLVKDRNIIFAVSKRYIKHLKKISNCISFINHLYRNNEKKCNIGNTSGCIFVFKGPYL